MCYDVTLPNMFRGFVTPRDIKYTFSLRDGITLGPFVVALVSNLSFRCQSISFYMSPVAVVVIFNSFLAFNFFFLFRDVFTTLVLAVDEFKGSEVLCTETMTAFISQ